VFYLRAMPKSSARANSKKSLKAKYKRIVLKLSGEALKAGGSQDNISPEIVQQICLQIQEVHDMGVEVAVVIGGGNIWRGLSAHHRGMERTTADYMGMLATVINGLALQSALEQMGLTTRVQTAIKMDNVAEPFIRRRAIDQLENGSIVIFVPARETPFSRRTPRPPFAPTKSARRSS
jgi:uridylate kinase